MSPIDRRAFLAALGAGVVAMGRDAQAESGGGQSRSSGRPLRFVGIYTPHGRAHELWKPRDGFELRFADSILQPFDEAEGDDPRARGGRRKSYKDRLLVIDGVDLAAGIAVGTAGHDGPRVILTGSGANGKNPSLDQYLAVDCGFGAETPHTALVLGVGNEEPEIGACISYGPGGTPLPKWIDPAQTFAELFGEPITGQGQAELARQRSLGRSVLDVAKADLARLAARAPSSERMKLDQHQTALREIEKRLSGSSASCPPPAAPDRRLFPQVRAHKGGAPYLDAITDAQIDLLARAFACDLTRFATLFLGDLSRTHLFPELPDDIHNDVAHRYDAATQHHEGNAATWRALAIQNRYSYGKVARLLARLDEAAVLDDTIVYVSGDMGDPNRHSSRSVPTLIAGGAGGRFKMGRYLDLRNAQGTGVPNNRLLVSIAQAFSVETSRFGQSADPAIVTGQLDALAG
jgi:hypothetical protein